MMRRRDVHVVPARAHAAHVWPVLEQVAQAAHPEPRATQAAGAALRAATALLNPPAAKAIRRAMALLKPPAARAKIASIPQGRELDRETTVRALESIGLSGTRP